VAADHGVAMVSREVTRRAYPGVRFVPLKGNPAVSAIHMAWRQGAVDRAPADLAHLLRRAGRHR
jgi:DNA-binding transcriptional LysR family regulator